MRKLNSFFDFLKFNKGKKYQITSVRYNEKRGLVTLDIAIVEDLTDYGDPSISNLYEKFKVHCIQDTNEDDVNKYAVGQMIVFKSIGKCSVYGTYNNELSVEGVLEVVK